jgi:tetratricopeptide (TPR) repeat protein
MRRAVEQVEGRLREFVEQREQLALILNSAAHDALPILKMLEGLEAASASDLFWVFSDAFTSTASYADAVIQAFSAKHELVRLLLEKEGMPPWPAIPAAIAAPGAPPATRLRALAAFSRELLPIPGGGHVVWAFFPLAISDGSAFASLMVEVLEHEFPFPWCHHLRFIARDDPAECALEKRLAGAPRIAWYRPDFGPEAIERSIEADLADDSRPLEERLTTLLVSAATDSAFQRNAQALAKYELLLRYHAPRGHHAMAAIALGGMGEIYERLGELERASASYEAALLPASHGEHPPIPVFLNVVLSLARLRTAQERWSDAEAYYDIGQQLATVARDPATVIRALEGRGTSQLRQGKSADALQSWERGLTLAAQLEDPQLCAQLLEPIAACHGERGDRARQREALSQLAQLRTPHSD